MAFNVLNPNGTVNLNDLARLALVASDASYSGTKWSLGAPLAPYEDSVGTEIPCPYETEVVVDSGYEVVRSFQDGTTGFKAVIFRNFETNDVIVAFAGSDGTNLKDWWGNTFHYGWNQWSRNSPAVFDFLSSLQGPGGVAFTGRIHFTGQSLGGALAQYAAYELIAQRKAANGSYVPSDLTLTTFNALGGVAALKEKIGTGFDASILRGVGSVAQYRTPNDFVSRLGEGHLGGNVVYELPFRPGGINPATNRPFEFEIVTGHRIESGFYANLREIDGWFSPAQRTLPKAGYLAISNLQRAASYSGNPFKSEAVSTPTALIRLATGVLSAGARAPNVETNGFIWSLAQSQLDAGALSRAQHESIARVDWGAAATFLAGTVSVVNPLVFVETWIGAVILGRLASGFGLSTSDAAQGVEEQFGPAGSGMFISADASPVETETRFNVLLARLDAETESPLASVDAERLAERLASGAGWENASLDYVRQTSGLTAAEVVALDGRFGSLMYDAALATTSGDGTYAEQLFAVLRSHFEETSKMVANSNANLTLKFANVDPTLFGTATDWIAYDAIHDALGEVASNAQYSEIAPLLEDALEIVESAGQTVVIAEGRPQNPFDDPEFDPDAAAVAIGAIKEGQVKTFTVFLPYEAQEGGQHVALQLGGSAAGRFKVLLDADEIDLGVDGEFDLLIDAGSRSISLGIWAQEDVDSDETLSLSATLVDAEGNATHVTHLELNLALDASDESLTPATAREINDTWKPRVLTEAEYAALGPLNPPPGFGFAVEIPIRDAAGAIVGHNYIRIDDLGNFERLVGVLSEPGDPLGGQSLLSGGESADHIVSKRSATTVGRGGNDWIEGGGSQQLVSAGSGDDFVEGGPNNLTLADTLTAIRPLIGFDNEVVNGFADDILYGNAGDDTLYGSSAAELEALLDPATLPANRKGDWIAGGMGEDEIYGSTADDALFGGGGEDTLIGGPGADVLNGDDDFGPLNNASIWKIDREAGSFEVTYYPVSNTRSEEFEYYKSFGADDVLDGGSGDDVLIGQTGNDTLIGGEGNDVLAGWEGDDVALGGEGDDRIAGDFGRLEAPGARQAGLDFKARAGAIGIFGAQNLGIEQRGNDFLDGQAGNDIIYGEGGDDLLLGGTGNDQLWGDADWVPEALAGNDLLQGGEGNDRADGGPGEDELRGDAGNDVLIGGPGNDRLFGGAGEDVLEGGEGADRLAGGAGFDILRGGAGDDTYLFGVGDGFDHIEDAEGASRIGFMSGIAKSDLGASIDGTTLTVTLGASGDRIEIDLAQSHLTGFDFGGSAAISPAAVVAGALASPLTLTDARGIVITYGTNADESLSAEGADETLHGAGGNDVLSAFAGANVLDGGEGDDILTGAENDDVLVGAAGNDVVAGGIGSDTYTFEFGDGQDTIVEIDPFGGYRDRIEFGAGILRDDVRLTALAGGDLRIGLLGTEDALTVRDWFNQFGAQIEELAFADGSTLALDGATVVAGGTTVDGGFGANVYLVPDVLETQTLIADSGAINPEDYPALYYESQGIDDWRVRERHGGSYFDPESDQDFDSIEAALVYYRDLLGDPDLGPEDISWVRFVEPLPPLPPLPGPNDFSALAALAATGVIERDIVQMPIGVAPGHVALSWLEVNAVGPSGNYSPHAALALAWDISNEIRLLIPHGDDPVGSGVEAVEFRDGTTLTMAEIIALAPPAPTFDPQLADNVVEGTPRSDAIDAGEGNDVVHGAQGDDHLRGGPGADTYVFNLGDGVDRIVDDAGEGNIVQFGPGITPDMLSLGLGSLVIAVGPDGDALHLENFDPANAAASGGIDSFRFASGETLSYAQLLEGGIGASGSEFADFLVGTSANDRIQGLGGDDFLSGEAGNDLLFGGAGDDTYYFAPGGGADRIEDPAGNDTVHLFGGIAPEDVTVNRAGDTLTLALSATADELQIRWQPELGHGVERVEFEDGTAWDAATLEALAGTGGNAAPTVATPLLDRVTKEDELFIFHTQGTFTDPGDTLSFDASSGDGSGLPAWLGFDPVAGAFRGTPENADVRSIEVKVTATDSGGLTASDSFMLTVENSNDAPVLNPLADQAVTVGTEFSHAIAGAFTDIDRDDELTFSATAADGDPLPAWLTFDGAAGAFVGTPGPSDVAEFTVFVTATDLEGASATGAFRLTVADDAGGQGVHLIGTDQGDTLTGTEFDDVLGGLSGRDELSGLGGDDLLNGGRGRDQLFGGDGHDSLYGERARDTLYGGAGDDFLDGGRAKDRLYGEAGDDVLAGGEGDDKLDGGAGNDVYFHDLHDGDDIIEEQGNGLDVLVFGEGISPEMVRLERRHDDLVVDFSGPHGSVTVKGWFASDSKKVEIIQFADGTNWGVEEIRDRTRRQGHDGGGYDDDHGHHHGDRHDDHHGGSDDRNHDDRDDDRPERERDDRMAECLAAYLADEPRYDFEALARELDQSGWRGEALSAQEIARRWQLVARYGAGLANEQDDAVRSGAVFRLDGHGLFGAGALGGGFGYTGSTGATRGAANLQTFNGLDEGFRRLGL